MGDVRHQVQPQRLLDRLQQQVDRLNRLRESGTSDDDLVRAIADLEDDIETIRTCFPFIYALPPILRRK